MTKVNFYDNIDDSMLKFAVIIARHNGKWVFCKHKERNTWEVPGGHREANEDIIDTAKRELFEETGAIDFDISPICIYSVTVPDNFDGVETFGKLFFAEIHTFEKEIHSEIEKIAIMDELPINWTYPEIQPKLLEEARKRGFLPKKDEIKWLFFDVGSTLVDESKVYEERMPMVKKILILCMTFICILSGCGNADSVQNTEQKAGYQQVSMEEGLELMKTDSGYILLDVRRTDEFEEGHIPGAINIPNESIGTEEIVELPDKNQTIYVYCRSGNRSKQASQKLVDLGYTNVIEFGGIIDYSGETTTGRQ